MVFSVGSATEPASALVMTVLVDEQRIGVDESDVGMSVEDSNGSSDRQITVTIAVR
ncbi:hypothetical protein H6F76_14550 [Leptolyngbya sp. FACHB-321]|uniref:hypothetical protein n=1 Tax=Leptolyngbya sp. FACHB-321 TaxID=2692807 RepID=UPI001689F766|nr:hypothetical protein [Leptolyngbya sp. FACHB-321]MBD2036235.1 hypothetical protein [Leptolyngbya sp. FACHB-321]